MSDPIFNKVKSIKYQDLIFNKVKSIKYQGLIFNKVKKYQDLIFNKVKYLLLKQTIGSQQWDYKSSANLTVDVQ